VATSQGVKVVLPLHTGLAGIGGSNRPAMNSGENRCPHRAGIPDLTQPGGTSNFGPRLEGTSGTLHQGSSEREAFREKWQGCIWHAGRSCANSGL
jgi:hypothetical protein